MNAAELVGHTLLLEHDEYMYGRGKVRIRVTQVHYPQVAGGEHWLFMRGMRISSTGEEWGERNILVKVHAIRRQIDIRVPPM